MGFRSVQDQGVVKAGLSLIAFLGVTASSFAATVSPPVDNFHAVTDQIWRSARPSETALKAMKKAGMTVDLDLENITSVTTTESSWSSRDGFEFLPEPMSATSPVSDAQINEILADLKTPPQSGVILVHCHYGEDRTGLVIGLYRVEVQGWTPANAYQEMLAYGFHPSLTELDQYFHTRTHWN